MSVFKELKKVVGEMPLSDQAKVLNCYNILKTYINDNGDAGILAISLIGAELSEALEDDNG